MGNVGLTWVVVSMYTEVHSDICRYIPMLIEGRKIYFQMGESGTQIYTRVIVSMPIRASLPYRSTRDRRSWGFSGGRVL